MRRAFVSLSIVVSALALAPVSAGIAGRPDWRLARSSAGPSARDAHAMAYDTRRGRVVLFAGANEFNIGDFSDTWEWDGTAWIERTPAASPPARFGHAMAYDSARGRVVVFGGYDFFSGIALADTWEWDGNTWTEMTAATNPPGRLGHAMAYDSARQRVVLFGGAGDSGRLADTWEWDGSAWLERTAAASPPPREFGELAYDSVRGRTVLFGGFDGDSYLADTWEWDGDAWVERVAGTSPPGRTWQMLAFDEARGRTVLFGGYDGSSLFGDTWEWDGNAWLETTSDTSPAPRVVGAMVFDRARSRVVLFGGYDGRDPLADTWEWDGSAWVETTPRTSPPRRSNHAAAFDEARGRTVIFGGYAGGPFLADTWEWDGAGWVQKTPATSPPSRIFHAMAYDRARARVVLFGGFGQRGAVADTWEWDGTDWVKKTPATSPPARHGQAMAYDAARERVVLFGGSDGVNLLADTWEWDGNNWVDVTPATGPPSRYRHAMTYDAARGRVVLFGGCGDVECPLGDTWEWDGSSWVEKTPATRPPARLEHALAYDEGRQRAVLFGGTAGFLYFGDTWEWDGTDWTLTTPASSPTARLHLAMTYDGASGHVLLFGGFDGTYNADAWEYGPIAAGGNRPPVADAGPDQILECDGSGQATASLDGSGSSDPDSTAGTNDDIVAYAWTSAGQTLATSATASVSLALGVHDVTLTVTDRAGATGSDVALVNVQDTVPPSITCPASVRVECQAGSSAGVAVPRATAGDSCSGTASIVNDHNAGGADASGAYSLGTTVVTFTARDGAGNAASCSTSVTVADTTPPVVTVRATPDVLWPPNHKMVPVRFTVLAVDACDPSPALVLESVASSEPDDAPGGWDGTTAGDIQGAAFGTTDVDVLLRAERDSRGPGRTYSARYRLTDASGNVAVGVGTVAVPHDRRRSPPQTGQGARLRVP